MEYAYESMGTHWKIAVWDGIFSVKLQNKIFGLSDNFDKTYSRFKKNSLIWKIAKSTGIIKVPADFVKILKIYFQLYFPSNKKLNPLIGNTLRDLGYDENYSFKVKPTIFPAPDLFETVEIIDEETIKINQPVLFDFGAVGKGFFVDKTADFLRQNGFKNFMVDGSGDIYYQNDKPLIAGLEHPLDLDKVIGTVEIKNAAMCSSANNRRKWGNYGHTIDPNNLTTPDEIIATWVGADSTALSDGLATCLFFVPPENFNINFNYVILNKEMRVKTNWPGLQLY